MCGIAGIIGASAHDLELLQAMGRTMALRGPDDAGEWACSDAELGLVHRRLSILDRSTAGRQPMVSRSGRFTIVYNGEVYNHKELRSRFEDSDWLGESDTETILRCFEAFGVAKSLGLFHGMFAFAVYDRLERKLILARDRAGEKPLYYGWQGHGDQQAFLFASTLAPIRLHPGFQHEIDRGALAAYLRYGYVPGTLAIDLGVKKLQPGSMLTLDVDSRQSEIHQYWSAFALAQGPKDRWENGPESEAIESLDQLLRQSISRQMISDVPLGAFLSGGIDSSLIVSIMQSVSSTPVNSFTVGFHEKEFDEAPYAKRVASHLGTNHHEVYVSAKDALEVIPRLAFIYDEPFADSSQIPTYLISALMKERVTVALSGDAGDELFCGYSRYLLTSSSWRRVSWMPLPVRRALARGVLGFSPRFWDVILSLGAALGCSTLKQLGSGDRVHKAASMLPSGSIDDLYASMVSHWHDPESIVIGAREPQTDLQTIGCKLDRLNEIEKMMILDLVTYLPGDILTKLDRAAMAVSLETRLPFLDHDIINFAWQLPLNLKLRDGQSKWILRQVLHRYVPESLLARPKRGFGIPLAAWLRGPLKEWSTSLLDPSRLRAEGFLDPGIIHARWNEHLSGKRNWSYQLWNVLMFQAWLETRSQHRYRHQLQPGFK